MSRASIFLLLPLLFSPSLAAQSFVNWETPQVHPLELTPDGALLLAVNTPDNRLEVFEATGGTLSHLASIPVGLDPVTVRARTASEAWVVNQISDTVSIVDLETGHVVATLDTADEPSDVVFAGTPQRAFVSCSQENLVQVFDPASLGSPPQEVNIVGEDPRALAVSADGSQVYAAIFESGNGSTILGGGNTNGSGPPNVVNHPAGPHGGVNPPPNAGAAFDPAIRPEYLPGGASPAPRVSLIVKRNSAGRYLDDNGGDWTPFVRGPQAPLSGRPVGWNLTDRDVAIVETSNLSVTYATRLLNVVMALAVHPVSGEVTAVGTDATNEIRFEPKLKGRFLRVNFARVDPKAPTAGAVVDLNEAHLTYSDLQVATQADPSTASQALRDMSVGDPRALVWKSDGARGYVAGMGSNNVVVIDAAGGRLSPLGASGEASIEVGEGPTGLALDEARGRLYVLNRFAASISIIDTAVEQEISRVALFDPTPESIRMGRKHLYDTRKSSGLGHVACASCHVDARMDRLAWDLGDPDGDIKALNAVPGQHNLGMNLPGLSNGFQPFHPLKGPMVTQTFQDIIGKEPFHWRGDRDGLEEFNAAFQGLQGDDEMLTPTEMQEYEDFLASIHFPPNPFRNLDNSLPTNLDLGGHFATGRFAGAGGLAAGEPLPAGSAVRGLALFRPPVTLDGVLPCVTCHSLPTGAGADVQRVGTQFLPIPAGPQGEHHLALVSVDGSTNVSLKTPQLRNMYDKVGFDTTQPSNRSGFGFAHSGSFDSITRFVAAPIFGVVNDQEVADMVAFMLAFSGSDLPEGSPDVSDGEPPGPPSLDTHAAVGNQVTVTETNRSDPKIVSRLAALQALADGAEIALVAKGRREGVSRGWVYVGAGQLQSDRAAEMVTLESLRLATTTGSEFTLTAVPQGTQERIGVDRDEDGFFDRDEIEGCSDPADSREVPADPPCRIFLDGFESGDVSAWTLSFP
ncbi:MAG: hypothetical protein K0U98_13830 [Deltaproteobacteria bacterium]|nr:hypothetical protein [Deltaproteobacteria bacterium]